MNEQAYEKLEFDAIRSRLVECCACSLGRERAAALRPTAAPHLVEGRLAETSEARLFLDQHGTPPFGGVSDVREQLTRARIGAALSARELQTVGDCLRGMRRLKSALGQVDDDEFPRLSQLRARLAAFPEVEGRIGLIIGDDGEVIDDASPELRRLRIRIARLREAIDQRVRAVLAEHANDTALQDRIVTMRRGRPCIPVRAHARRSFPGVVHDVSSSGATLFVEPSEVVDQGDELQQCLAGEQEEVARILRELSRMVGEVADAAQESLAASALLDYVFARGRLSQQMDAVAPELASRYHIRLIRARHPLIPPAEVVPIDVWIGEDFGVLLITGPNTGGKTVTLKTVGLLALMAQSGLHIPADPGSSLPVLKNVFADIGDEQSIAQNLSTFSSHMRNVVRICRKAREGSLVLLDEVGAGTDPEEGAALAQAVMRFLRQRGALVLCTTHYNSLKVFALNEPGMMNASVEFDQETLAPTYRLRIGVPGSSNALSIAARLGLNADVVRAARELVSAESGRVEDVVARLETARRELERERAEHRRALAQLQESQASLDREREALEAERRRALKEGFAESRAVVQRARDEAREIIRALRDQRSEGKATQRATDQLAELARAVDSEAQAAVPPETRSNVPEVDVREGDVVMVSSLGGKRGVVLSGPRDGRVRVSAGAVQVEVPVSDLQVLSPVPDREMRERVGAIRVEKAFTVPLEIDLRGLTVDEAIVSIDKFLDDAALAEHERVALIHGKGTGALRQGVRAHLRGHKAVKDFHDAPPEAGGSGVTLVHL